ncbi:uncharacterized protein LOC113981146 isoform X1 [Neopelma chrysocephalum]|uniref:uncharacterized protein LOC113981146 isoform X1 n=1 Tax=Neopelma chrysocephalum TaxID=114329 RepID=UPI000FCD238C|nr:uncharacterized protein LOC113981146 isoform X1 [Neopelma chrysocephalum]
MPRRSPLPLPAPPQRRRALEGRAGRTRCRRVASVSCCPPASAASPPPPSAAATMRRDLGRTYLSLWRTSGGCWHSCVGSLEVDLLPLSSLSDISS